jgi:hypothetical protein
MSLMWLEIRLWCHLTEAAELGVVSDVRVSQIV